MVRGEGSEGINAIGEDEGVEVLDVATAEDGEGSDGGRGPREDELVLFGDGQGWKEGCGEEVGAGTGSWEETEKAEEGGGEVDKAVGWLTGGEGLTADPPAEGLDGDTEDRSDEARWEKVAGEAVDFPEDLRVEEFGVGTVLVVGLPR